LGQGGVRQQEVISESHPCHGAPVASVHAPQPGPRSLHWCTKRALSSQPWMAGTPVPENSANTAAVAKHQAPERAHLSRREAVRRHSRCRHHPRSRCLHGCIRRGRNAGIWGLLGGSQRALFRAAQAAVHTGALLASGGSGGTHCPCTRRRYPPQGGRRTDRCRHKAACRGSQPRSGGR
jgi:hypothetical protein